MVLKNGATKILFEAGKQHYMCRNNFPSPLTVNICWDIPKYDEVWFVKSPPEDPIQPILIVDEDALFGHAVRNHPDTQ